MLERNKYKIKTETHDRSVNEEDLHLTGYGCSMPECDWNFNDSNISHFFRAIRKHGEHNKQKHLFEPESSTTFVYIRTRKPTTRLKQ